MPKKMYVQPEDSEGNTFVFPSAANMVETEDGTMLDDELKRLKQNVDDMDQQVSVQIAYKLATVISDIAKLSFQLDLKNTVDTSDMTHVIVDVIDAADAVVITSGTFKENTVYI